MKNNTSVTRILHVFILTFFLHVGLFAQVGIGTTTPTTTLDVNGAISLRDGGTLTLTNGNNNNINLGAVPYSNYRIIGPTTSFFVNSLIPIASSDGQIITLQNTTNAVMIIRHDAGGNVNNRILVPSEKNLVLTGRYSSVTLMYSDNQNRWIVQNKLSDETIYVTAPADYAPFTIYNLTYPIAACTSTSAVSVNLLGDWSVLNQPWEDITIHHVEARTGEVRFVLVNSSPGTTYIGMDFVISVRN
ncbi:hypothetical protein [Bizionia sp.]|uniref:hypothetical protein n=1 Tax=Bizionia sp. TaxID=1954480 RepID=UPI003A914B0A